MYKALSFDYYIFLLVILSLPFGKRFLLPVFFIWLCLIVISYFIKKDFTIDRLKSLLILPIILFLLLAASFSFSPSFHEYLSDLQLKVSLLLLPLFYPYQREEYKNGHRFFLWFFVASCAVASIFYFGYALYRSCALVNDVWVFNPIPTGSWNNYFFSKEFSYLIHPSYFALYLLVALLIIIIEQNLWWKRGIRVRLIVIFITLIITLSLMFLQSRAGILGFGMLALVWLFYIFFMNRKIKLGIGLLIVLFCLSFLIISKFNRITKTVRFFEITKDLELTNQNREDETTIRFWIWRSSFSAIKDHPLWGVGPSNVKEVLLKEYLKRDMRVAASEKMNAHNQYLETWLGMGLFGFLILLSMLIVPMWYGFKRKDWLLLGFLCLVSFSFIFESMLERISGIVFFIIFYTILASQYLNSKKEEKK